MNETYELMDELSDSMNAVTYGRYVELVFHKHEKKYGSESASRIRENVCSIFKKCVSQLKRPDKNNNVLLIGKVQSGKTSNLEMFTAMAFDNGYNCMVIYGGYDTKLLAQTCKRFKKTFDIDEDSMTSTSPELFSTSDGNAVDALDDTLISNLVKKGKPLIFVSMKRPVALQRINAFFSNCDTKGINAFIIDDEGDQASLNTQIRKNKASKTYEEIMKMKGKLHDPLYLSVTATPQANVLLGEYSGLKPDSLRLIPPGNGYTGGESFHLKETNVVTIRDDGKPTDGRPMAKSLCDAINYFLVASAVMETRGINKNGINYSDMIIHTSRTKADHRDLYTPVFNYIESLKNEVRNPSEDFEAAINSVGEVFNERFFPASVLTKYKFENLREELCDVITNTHIILQDGDGGITQEHEKYKHHKIYIGGDLLQRGLTFEYLVTTYFTRWPKSAGNMDTTIQRARWFGYRADYLDLCKIFTTEEIKLEYSALTESENDLWEQCRSIEDGQLGIKDIVIDADSTSLKPTRRNVALFHKISFTRKWNNQRIGVADKIILDKNNSIIKKFLDSLTWSETSVGRTDQKVSAFYSVVSQEQVCSLIKDVQTIFDEKPFGKKDLIYALEGKKIVIEKMFGTSETNLIRERTFDPTNMHISALQQGADTTVVEERKYLGDSFVVVDDAAVTIQVFMIRPIINDIPDSKLDQYFFSVHVPEGKEGFVRDDQR